MKIFVENIYSHMRSKVYDTTGGSRNKLKFLPQSHNWNPLLYRKLRLIVRRKARRNSSLYVVDGKQSNFQAFIVYFLLLYVKVNRNKQ
jgi:hypothetical protein